MVAGTFDFSQTLQDLLSDGNECDLLHYSKNKTNLICSMGNYV